MLKLFKFIFLFPIELFKLILLLPMKLFQWTFVLVVSIAVFMTGGGLVVAGCLILGTFLFVIYIICGILSFLLERLFKTDKTLKANERM